MVKCYTKNMEIEINIKEYEEETNMENKTIIEFIGALRGDIKAIVKEAVAEVLAERNIFVGGVDSAKETNPHTIAEKAVNRTEGVKEEASKADPSPVIEGREAELKAMKYNDLKALVSKLGGKAVGKAPDLIAQILELEAKMREEEDAKEAEQDQEEVNIENANDDSKADDQDDNSEEIPEEVSEDEYEGDEDENEQAFRDFLLSLDKDELLEIGEKLDLKAPKNWNKAGFVEMLIIDLDALYSALEELGYYDEEDGDKEDLVESADEDTEDTDADEREETTLVDELEAKTVEELAEICTENGLSAKGKKQALIDRIVKAVEAGDITIYEEDTEDTDNSEEGEDDDWYTAEELSEMSTDELVELAELNEIEVPKKKVGKKSVINRVALIEALVALGEADEDAEEAGDDSDEDGDGFEVSEKRTAKEDEIEEEIRAQYKAKKLKYATIKKFLEKYNEGNPKYTAPTKDEALEQYIEAKVGLVDDEGEVHDMEECYIRDGEYFCCGRQLEELEGEPYCPICGTQYES